MVNRIALCTFSQRLREINARVWRVVQPLPRQHVDDDLHLRPVRKVLSTKISGLNYVMQRTTPVTRPDPIRYDTVSDIQF